MNRRERLMATLRGERVDRPAVSFYEIGGWELDADDPDPFNIYNGPGWRDLIDFTEAQTDLIRMVNPRMTPAAGNTRAQYQTLKSEDRDNARYNTLVLNVGGRELVQCTRRDADVATVWTTEHLLKSKADAEAYLHLPQSYFAVDVDIQPMLDSEARLGDRGIVMVDIADPLCAVAGLFSMADYTIIALTEPVLFHQLLEHQAEAIYHTTEIVARTFPGHLWRIVGSEYASVPFLPPRLYREYEARYTQPMIDMIQKYGGYARLHSHGRLRHILPAIMDMHPDALDPLEPPPQGDMGLADIKKHLGKDVVLFGNIEASEIETLSRDAFEKRVVQAVREGMAGEGRGFVLMPSACPYGREISAQVLRNYEIMVEAVQNFSA